MKLGIVAGSLRRESFSRKIAGELLKLLPDGITAEFLNIDLPLYNQDFDDDGNPPKAYTDFRKAAADCDAYLFVTPEYNRSIPPAIKNALDVGSRAKDGNVFSGKKGAVVSVSPGAIGGFGANHALRQAVVYLNITMLAQPEMYIGGVTKLFESDGKLNEKTVNFFQTFITEFTNFLGLKK